MSKVLDDRELPDYLNDAIDNLVHDNYERSQAGSRNWQADAELIRAALATLAEQQPVAWQHKKPTVNDSGEIVGYSAWTNGKGLDWWPHRPLYAAPIAQTAPQVQSGLYTCIGKGGAYELIGRAKTAGVLKVTGRFADEVIVYRDTKSNALYCREPGDFRLRMARAAIDDAMRQT